MAKTQRASFPAMTQASSLSWSARISGRLLTACLTRQLSPGFHRITESQNSRGWKGPLWVISVKSINVPPKRTCPRFDHSSRLHRTNLLHWRQIYVSKHYQRLYLSAVPRSSLKTKQKRRQVYQKGTCVLSAAWVLQ